MAGPAPKTQKWTARENKQGDQLVLVVGGQVEVTGTYRVPKLAEGGPLRDPHTLDLELTIVDSDNTGAEVVVWMPASFQKEVTADEYHDVVVRWDDEKIAQFAVIDDAEREALMDKQSKAQNTVAKVATKKPAAKKAAKKAAKAAPTKVAPKKAAKKAVKKAAKKTVKKAAKKGAKKVAKKVAKKKAAKKAAKKKKR